MVKAGAQRSLHPLCRYLKRLGDSAVIPRPESPSTPLLRKVVVVNGQDVISTAVVPVFQKRTPSCGIGAHFVCTR